jgi:hypothetical protein
MAADQQAHGSVRQGSALHLVAGLAQAIAHETLRLTAIQVHLQPGPRRNALQGKAGADEVDRAGHAAQIQALAG